MQLQGDENIRKISGHKLVLLFAISFKPLSLRLTKALLIEKVLEYSCLRPGSKWVAMT
jgi:hypothetical protein